MHCTKLKVNLSHKLAIYVYLTFKIIINVISPVSRLESESGISLYVAIKLFLIIPLLGF